jgi:hypothetical protein
LVRAGVDEERPVVVMEEEEEKALEAGTEFLYSLESISLPPAPSPTERQ